MMKVHRNMSKKRMLWQLFATLAAAWLPLFLSEASSPSDANYDAIIDPVKLADMSNSLIAAVTFDEADWKWATMTEALSGKGLDLAKTRRAVTFDCQKVINGSAGAVSWWVCFRSEVQDKSIRLAQVDDGGRMYIMYQGSQAFDTRHRHRLGHYFFPPKATFIQYAHPLCPTSDKPDSSWVNITWTWEANRSRVYVDGDLAVERTHDESVAKYAEKFVKLQLGAPGQDAILDEVRFYNRTLSQADIKGFIAAVRSSALRKGALELPAMMAGKVSGSCLASYRVSDHALVLFSDLSQRMATAGTIDVAVIGQSGETVFKGSMRVDNPKVIFQKVIPLPADLAAATYTLCVQPPDDKPALTATFSLKHYPWENNRIGIPDGVPQPWTALQVDPRSGSKAPLICSVWGRKVVLNSLGLPMEIQTTQPEPTRGPETVNILAAPVSFNAVQQGRTFAWEGAGSTVISQSDREVIVQAGGQNPVLNMELQGTLEFDGFYKVSVRLTPRQPGLSLDRLYVEIPVPDEQAVLFNAASDSMRAQKTFLNVQDKADGVLWDSIQAITGGPEQVLTAPGKLRPVPVWPHAWLGNDDRGIALMVDNTQTWPIDTTKPAMELVRKGGVTALRLLLVNIPTVVEKPIELTFSVQATPTRPRPAGGAGKNLEWYGWGYFDLPVISADLEPGAISRQEAGARPWYRTAQARAENRWWRYGCLQSHRVPVDDPVYGDMIKATRNEWENGLYTPSHINFLLWVYKKWHDKESMDGMYYDNTYPQRANTFGSGLAYLDGNGTLQPSYNVFGQREFMKRVQGYFQSVGELPVMMAHVTDCPAVGYLGFADFWLDGENGGYLEYRKQVDHDEGRAKYDFIDRWYNPTGLANLRTTLGRQWGTVPKYLYVWYPEATYAMLGMHDLDHHYEPMGRKPYHDFGRYEADVQFIPYWSVNHPLTLRAGGPDVFLTAWKRPDRARILVSNLSQENRRVDIRVDLAALGLPANVDVLDEREGSAVSVRGGVLRGIDVPARSYRTLILAKPGLYEPLNSNQGQALLPSAEYRVAELCDDFSSIQPVWEKQISNESWRGTGDSRKAKERSVRTDPISVSQGYLKIRNGSGLAHNIRRPFKQDNCSVTLKLREPLCGLYEPKFGPGMRLIWADGKEIAITAWERGPESRKDRFHAVGPGLEKWGDIPATVNWLRIDLDENMLLFKTSNNGETWQELASMPRTDLVGAPAELVIGHGNRTDASMASYFYISFFDELVVTRKQ